MSKQEGEKSYKYSFARTSISNQEFNSTVGKTIKIIRTGLPMEVNQTVSLTLPDKSECNAKVIKVSRNSEGYIYELEIMPD